MLITREADYAIRILRALSTKEQLTVTNLCQQEMLPLQFAYKILKKLNTAKIIKVLRGAVGGCQLQMDLKELTLYDLLLALEIDNQLNSCMRTEHSCEWQKEHRTPCMVHTQLAELQESFNNELKKKTLHEVIFGKSIQ